MLSVPAFVTPQVCIWPWSLNCLLPGSLHKSVLTPWLREHCTRTTDDTLGDDTSKTQEKLLQNLWHRAYFGATVSTINSLLILIANKVPLYILASKCLDTKGIQHISSLAFWGEEGTYAGTEAERSDKLVKWVLSPSGLLQAFFAPFILTPFLLRGQLHFIDVILWI